MDKLEPIAAEILQIAKSREDEFEADFFGPVSDDVIGAAELELGLQFPETYRAFLREFGAAWMIGYDFSGLPDTRNTDNTPRVYDHVVDSTKEDWKGPDWRGGVPKSYIHVSEDGGDYRFYIDTAQRDARGECPVVAWGPGADGTVVASDFLEFVRKLAGPEDLY